MLINYSKTEVAREMTHGSVSVFQVGSVFVVGFSKHHDIGSVFSAIYFASFCQKFCFRVSQRILTEDPCPHDLKLAPPWLIGMFSGYPYCQ